jgi:outer membrane protein
MNLNNHPVENIFDLSICMNNQLKEEKMKRSFILYCAVELDITHTGFDANLEGIKAGDFNTNNVSLGAQYRFVDIPVKKLVPYVGAGLDILFNDFNSANGNNVDVDTVAGVHVSGGADYFILKQLALTAELKGVVAPNADINVRGEKVGNYDPTSLSMTFGVRYFFN